MRLIESKDIKMAFDDGGSVFESLRIVDCNFDNCGLSLSKRPESMSVVRDVLVSNCNVVNSEIGPTVFEDVVIDGLAVNPILLFWSCFFRRFVFSGKVGKIKINIEPSAFCKDGAVLAKFADMRSKFYAQTDWAMDISSAKFTDFACKGVPLNLVRRDPETQAVLRQEKFPGLAALGANFDKAFPETYTRLDMFEESGADEVLLAVPLAAPKKRRDDWAGGLAELRRLEFIRD